MHKNLERVFAENAAPTHASRADVHAQLTPISRLAAQAQKQMIEYDTLVTEAIQSPEHDHSLDPKLESVRQKVRAARRAADALAEAGHELTRIVLELDEAFPVWQADIERMTALATARGLAADVNA